MYPPFPPPLKYMPPPQKHCPRCNGQTTVPIAQGLLGRLFSKRVKCWECDGTGKTIEYLNWYMKLSPIKRHYC